MNALSTLLSEIVFLLDNSGFCDHPQLLETSFFSTDQFVFKIRTTIFSSLTFQIRIFYNQGHCRYSYQVFDKNIACRWDNKQHFPELKTFPHHYHAPNGETIESPLTGDPVNDLKKVLVELERLFKT